MSFKKRVTAVGILAAMLGTVFLVAGSGMEITKKQEEIPVFTGGKETVSLWYTDEALTSYLSAAAVAYNETHDVRVVPVLESGAEYLEKINQNSLAGKGPDLYLLGHDSLEKAYLAGLADEISPPPGMEPDKAYISTGISAVTYKDKLIGYPFYFETSSLLYNRTYLEDMAAAQLQAEADKAAAEEAEQRLSEEGPVEEASLEETGGRDEGMPDLEEAEPVEETERTSKEQALIEERVQELIPSTIEEIKTFADHYDAPEQVESVFKWDVTDIFYNYFFIGDAIHMGGEAGYDVSQVDIYNQEAIENMRSYEELNQFFSIDTNEISYDKVLDEFMAGKIVFTVATTDAVMKLEQAREDGLFAYEYGTAMVPDIDEEKQTRSLSMTSCAVVNGYSEHKEEANDFAAFLTSEYNDTLYARSGKASAAREAEYGYEALQHFAEEYENSISMPKMIETSNFWVQLEVVFAEVWDGADANLALKKLSEQMMQQITGREYEEAYIEEPKKQEEPSYSD